MRWTQFTAHGRPCRIRQLSREADTWKVEVERPGGSLYEAIAPSRKQAMMRARCAAAMAGRVVEEGRQDAQGYLRRGKQYIHRQVLERALGRRLTRTEVAHHLNGVKTDNRLSNLVVLNRADHVAWHNQIAPKRARRRGVSSDPAYTRRTHGSETARTR